MQSYDTKRTVVWCFFFIYLTQCYMNNAFDNEIINMRIFQDKKTSFDVK